MANLSFTSCLLRAVDTPPRLFFSDAKLSFVVPSPWDVPSTFPFGPLLTRKTQEGTDAFIVCQISNPVDPTGCGGCLEDALKAFATQDIDSRKEKSRILASTARTLMDQNAYEVTWLSEGPEGTIQYQSDIFFHREPFL